MTGTGTKKVIFVRQEREAGGFVGRRGHEEGNPTCTATHTPGRDETIDDAVQEKSGGYSISRPVKKGNP